MKISICDTKEAYRGVDRICFLYSMGTSVVVSELYRRKNCDGIRTSKTVNCVKNIILDTWVKTR